ncbi:hypothetical protein GCM10028795_28050 [Lysobacter olei]
MDGLTHIGAEYTCRTDIRAIDDLVLELTKTREQLFAHASWLCRRRRRVIITPLGERFLRGMNADFPMINTLFPNSRLSPNAEPFERHLKESGLQGEHFDIYSVDAFNQLVESIRREARKSRYIKDLANYRRASKKNHESLRSYLCQLRCAYSKLLVIRLDLHYARPLTAVPQMTVTCPRC